MSADAQDSVFQKPGAVLRQVLLEHPEGATRRQVIDACADRGTYSETINTYLSTYQASGRIVRKPDPNGKRCGLFMVGDWPEREVGVTPARTKSILAPREVEVLQFVFIGKSNQEIGQLLGISRLTVKNHVQKIIAKLRVYSRAGAVYEALRRGLIDPPPREASA